MKTQSINKRKTNRVTVKPQSLNLIDSQIISHLLINANVEVDSEEQTIFLEAFQVHGNYNQGYVISIETSSIDGDWDMTISLDGTPLKLSQSQKELIENQIYNHAIAV